VTGNVSPESASIHLPFTNACRCRSAGSTAVTSATIIERVQPQFVRLDAVRAFELAEGVTGQPLFGEGAMLNLIRFEPGATVPLHSHPHEQLGIVLEGMQALVVEGVAHELGPLQAYVLPGGVEHSAYAGPNGSLVLDVFRPVREDYRERWESEEP
jgi:quercetin dioxygenase-like cupin family protein